MIGFSQCLSGDCENGQGVYTWGSGDKYEGGFMDGLFHGQGTHTYGNGQWEGDKYVGEYKNGNMHGQGTYIYASGDKYEGKFKDGNWNGYGTYTYGIGGNEEEKYVGEFKDGQMHGQGTYTYSDKKNYVGEWMKGQMHGQGTFTWADGDKYVGEYKDGKQDGQGTYTYTDGEKYRGQYKNGQRHGQGTYTYANRNREEGEWKNNEIWNGTYIFYSDKKGEEGLEVKIISENGNVIDTIANNKNYYNIEDVIGDEVSQTIKLIDNRSKYDIILEVNDVPIRWRFDTGAEVTSISINQWEQIKSKIKYEDLKITRETQGVGGFATGDLVKIKDEIRIGEYLVKNFIVSIANNDHSLLGIDFLQKFSNVEWNMKEATLKIYK